MNPSPTARTTSPTPTARRPHPRSPTLASRAITADREGCDARNAGQLPREGAVMTDEHSHRDSGRGCRRGNAPMSKRGRAHDINAIRRASLPHGECHPGLLALLSGQPDAGCSDHDPGRARRNPRVHLRAGRTYEPGPFVLRLAGRTVWCPVTWPTVTTTPDTPLMARTGRKALGRGHGVAHRTPVVAGPLPRGRPWRISARVAQGRTWRRSGPMALSRTEGFP